jgi:CheY-like chemotaxis protein
MPWLSLSSGTQQAQDTATMGGAQFTRRWARDLLLVEDDDDFREGLADILRSEGYSVACAANGLQALEYLKSGQAAPSVILLDMMMPVMDGWKFRQRMLAEASLADIPVILMSALRDLPDAASLRAAGAVNKPVEFTELLRMIEGQVLEICALCRASVGEERRPIVVRGALAVALCEGCRDASGELEEELVAALERCAIRRSPTGNPRGAVS